MIQRLIIDSGHGFYTQGKESSFNRFKSGLFKGKPILKENNVNEAVCNKVSVLRENVQFITNEWNDVPLGERCRREHKLYIPGKSLFMSIHSDAYTTNKANGATVHYFSNSGKVIAEAFTQFLLDNKYPMHVRTPVKSNFYVLKNTSSPAILFEMGFMTYNYDLRFLMSEDFRNKVAKLIVKFSNEYTL